ncbi:MAG: phosphoglycerate dehydrogenase [Planctomycetota bacterium]
MADNTADQRILVADKLAEEGLEFLNESGVSYDVKTGLDEAGLIAEAPNYDAIACRSGIKVTAPVLEAGAKGKLKAVARAGVGVDNIDLDAATNQGVLVLNTAAASTLSTAEHAIALMYALARKIPAADAHVRGGEWKRGSFKGTQLAGKTLGVVGLGRIGQTVAVRALAMEMNVVGFDPFFPADTALDGKVKIVKDFDEFLAQLDVITFHVPSGDSTKHLLDKRRLFEVAKPNLLVVNDARGEVLDEFALAEALEEKKIAGAAVDVYATEPPQKDHPLFGLDNVVLTPHLGASTEEAQTAVSVEACKALVAYLQSGEIRGAVNAGGIKLDVPADEQPLLELASRIGRLLSAYGKGGIKSITLRASGTKAPKHLQTMLRLAAVELLRDHMAGPTNVINVEKLAGDRGIELNMHHEPSPPNGLVGDIVGVRVDSTDGESHRILGTAYLDRLPRVLRFDDFNVDMIPAGPMVLIENDDQPGVIGHVGATFGEAGVNIADMVISRVGDKALMVLKTDGVPSSEVMDTLRSRANVKRVKAVTLPGR